MFKVILKSFGAFSIIENFNNLENGGSQRKMRWNIWPWDINNTSIGYLWPCSVQGQFGVIQCTCLTMAYMSKAAGRRATQSEIWVSGVLVIHILSTFGLVGFKVIFKSLSALLPKLPASRKRLVIQWNGVKLGLMDISNAYRVQGHFGVILMHFFKMACI